MLAVCFSYMPAQSWPPWKAEGTVLRTAKSAWDFWPWLQGVRVQIQLKGRICIRSPQLLTPTQVWGFPKTTLRLGSFLKIQNSPKPIICMVMFLTVKGYIKIDQGKRSIGQSLGRFQTWCVLCPQWCVTKLVWTCGKRMAYCQSEKLPKLRCPEFLGGFIIEAWWINWTQTPAFHFPWSQADISRPKSPKTIKLFFQLGPPHSLRLLGVDDPNPGHLLSINCQVASERPPWVRRDSYHSENSHCLEVIRQE